MLDVLPLAWPISLMLTLKTYALNVSVHTIVGESVHHRRGYSEDIGKTCFYCFHSLNFISKSKFFMPFGRLRVFVASIRKSFCLFLSELRTTFSVRQSYIFHCDSVLRDSESAWETSFPFCLTFKHGFKTFFAAFFFSGVQQ